MFFFVLIAFMIAKFSLKKVFLLSFEEQNFSAQWTEKLVDELGKFCENTGSEVQTFPFIELHWKRNNLKRIYFHLEFLISTRDSSITKETGFVVFKRQVNRLGSSKRKIFNYTRFQNILLSGKHRVNVEQILIRTRFLQGAQPKLFIVRSLNASWTFSRSNTRHLLLV